MLKQRIPLPDGLLEFALPFTPGCFPGRFEKPALAGTERKRKQRRVRRVSN